MRGTAAAVLLLTLALSGCGNGAPAEPAPSTTASSPSPSPSTVPPGTPPPSTGPSSPSTPSLESPPLPPMTSLTVPVLPTPQDRGIVEGADVSWPQCPAGMGIPQKRSHGAPMPLDSAEFVILGLTNGPAFYPNPCLAEQVAWVRKRRLMAAAYSVLSYPEPRHLRQYGGQGPYDAGTRLGRLGNVGYQQALFNLETMRRAGLLSPVVWLDVETVPDFDWPRDDPEGNAAVVRGAERGYSEAGLLVGVYSTQHLWRSVVGDLRLGLPEWRAAGQTSRAEALRRCGPERMIQGGAAILAQWVELDRDRNVTCPGESAYLGLWFHQY